MWYELPSGMGGRGIIRLIRPSGIASATLTVPSILETSFGGELSLPPLLDLMVGVMDLFERALFPGVLDPTFTRLGKVFNVGLTCLLSRLSSWFF